jgi:DNA-binding response OmpR family regulator
VFRVRVSRGAPQEALSESPIVPLLGTLAGRRILVVDDEAAVRDGMRDALVAWGCTADVFAGPADVPAGMPAPDVLVVDYRLAGGAGGITAIAELRSRFRRDVPALLVSGESSVAELARINASGIPLLHKPVPPARLRAALLYVLRGEGIAGSG